jgi:hypothetical protein
MAETVRFVPVRNEPKARCDPPEYNLDAKTERSEGMVSENGP